MSTELLPGIDKIWLYTRDFEVNDKSVLDVNRDLKAGQKDEDLPLLFVDKKGEPMYGMKAKHIGKNQNLPYFASINKIGLSVQFNPSKIIHPYQLLTDVNLISSISDQIESELYDIGIKFNPSDCGISRMDLAKQDLMSRDLTSYRTAYEFMDGKRMKSKGYETGYLFENGNHEVCFYDKGIESKIKDAEGLLRVEPRFKDNDLIRKRLGYNTFADFLKSDANEWNEHYKKYLNEKIFRKSKQGYILDFNTELETLKSLKERGNNSVTDYLLIVGIDLILLQFGSMDFLFDLMKKAGYHRNYIRTTKTKIQSLMTSHSKGKIVSISTLINELQQKFAA